MNNEEMRRNLLHDYLQNKNEGCEIELYEINEKYSNQYGWEYHLYYHIDNVTHKEIISQARYSDITYGY